MNKSFYKIISNFFLIYLSGFLFCGHLLGDDSDLVRLQRRAEALEFLNRFPKLRILSPYTPGHGGVGMAVAVLDALEELGYTNPIELLVPSESHYQLLNDLFPTLSISAPSNLKLPGYQNVQILPGWMLDFPVSQVGFAIIPAKNELGRFWTAAAVVGLHLKPPYWHTETGLSYDGRIISSFGDEECKLGFPTTE